MNWVFEAYSNTYNTAMMNNRNSANHIAVAKGAEDKKASRFIRLFSRK